MTMNVAFGPELSGRMEKRLPIAILVHLARVQDEPLDKAELTYTENVSGHGACVVSTRAWLPGDLAQITSLRDQIALCGKVVHCSKYRDDRYAVGLAFKGHGVNWARDDEAAGS